MKIRRRRRPRDEQRVPRLVLVDVGGHPVVFPAQSHLPLARSRHEAKQ